jgi:hypothetical protein
MKQFLTALLLAVLCLPVFARSANQRSPSNHSLGSVNNHSSLQNAHSLQSLAMQSRIVTSALNQINAERNDEAEDCCFKTSPSSPFSAVKTSLDFVNPNQFLVRRKDFQSKTQGMLFIAKDIP